MSQACSISTHRVYGLQRVCQLWGFPRSTVYAKRQGAGAAELGGAAPQRRGPQGPCADGPLVSHIRRVLAETPFHGEGYRKVWAKLRLEGVRTSKERVRRLMAAYQLQVAGPVGQAHGPKAHDGVIITDQPDVMWGTDATTALTVKEGQAFVFVAVDHCNFECLGLHASAKGNRFEALEPLRQGVREQFGGYTQGIAVWLKIRHDHGSAYLADDFQQELKFLGMESSPSFVREPQGNGCAERFIRLLKENLLWVRSFDTIEELRLALLEFKHTYNTQWLLERHGYQTPAQVRQEKQASRLAEAAG